MWVWKIEFDRIRNRLVEVEIEKATLTAENKFLRERVDEIKDDTKALEDRNQSIFDMLMQIKHQHPGTGYQDAMKVSEELYNFVSGADVPRLFAPAWIKKDLSSFHADWRSYSKSAAPSPRNAK